MKSLITDLRWGIAITATLYAGAVGYPWLWFSGEKFIDEMARLDRIRNFISGNKKTKNNQVRN